ncbi:MAG: Chemotaxis protein CheW [Phycisphaerae bacterium]|nr:Chemotaxis protein CheW [Phycisphaerae bacterium]
MSRTASAAAAERTPRGHRHDAQVSHRETGPYVLAFQLADDEFGVDVACVARVIPNAGVTPVPNSPAHIRGLLSLEGRIIPVIDARVRLGRPRISESAQASVIVLNVAGGLTGLVVDAVGGVLRVGEIDCAAPPAGAGMEGARYLRGVARLKDRWLVLLDVGRVCA